MIINMVPLLGLLSKRPVSVNKGVLMMETAIWSIV